MDTSPGSPKPVLAIDVDEVLAAFLPALCSFHNDTYGSQLSIQDFHSYNFHEVWGGTSEEAKTKMNTFFASDYFKNITPIAGAFETMTRLYRYFELHIVTSRSFNIETMTREWIDEHFPGLFTALHFGNHYGVSGLIRSKPEMCADINALLLIDDSSLYASQCAAANVNVVLFGNYAWNRMLVAESAHLIRRAQDWGQAYTEVHQIISERHADASEYCRLFISEVENSRSLL